MPVGVAVAGANRHDGVRATPDSIPVARPTPTAARPQGTCEARKMLAEFGCTAHIRARDKEAQAIKREAGVQISTVGGGAHASLAESLSGYSDLLGEASRDPSGTAAHRDGGHYRPSSRVFRIGSKFRPD
jgi:hypothetical protein